MRQRTIIGGLIVLIVVIGIVVFFAERPSAPVAGASPPDEVAFIKGMSAIMDQVQAGGDPADWRQKRAAMVCQTISNLQVSNWTGTVDKLDNSIAGGAIMSVAVMPNVDFGTATNIISNASSNTFIDPGSALFHTITTLQVGQKIIFSGQLFASTDDCVQEASITTAGSMQNPLYITRFTAIAGLPHSDN